MRSNRLFLPFVLVSSSFVLALPAAPLAAAGYVGQTYGAAVSAAHPMPIESALARAKEFADKPVAVAGKVSAVCTVKGCWLTLVGGETGLASVHMTFKDYGVFVPTDLTGHTVVAEGIFKTETSSVEEQRHLAKDAGKPQEAIEKITQPKVETSFEATGVRVVAGPS